MSLRFLPNLLCILRILLVYPVAHGILQGQYPQVLGLFALAAFTDGLDALAPSARKAALVGALLGVALSLAEKFAPGRLKQLVPSASGLGIALVIPGSNAISMFLGSLVAELLRRFKPALAERAIVPVSSGFIAGESLMGIAIALLVVLGVLG